ncbi:MAG: hypothetical protein HY833_02210 [Candidatus Aenigmarchaeota archaeon]|nr:hypothetical protein [Candidatus Aenigmarchaeota archaeon]
MRLAVFLEHALSPLTLPLFAMSVILYASLGTQSFVPTLLTSAIPIAVYCAGCVVARRFSKNENVYFSVPCLPALASFIVIYSAYGPMPILLLSTATVCAFFTVVYLLRTYWRISMHMMFYAGVSAILSIMDAAFLPMFALVPAVAWCRLSLKRHTPMQLAAGFAVGLAAPISMGVFLGLV